MSKPSEKAMQLAQEVCSVAYGFNFTPLEIKEIAERIDTFAAKAHDVYECEWVAVPKINKEETNGNI